MGCKASGAAVTPQRWGRCSDRSFECPGVYGRSLTCVNGAGRRSDRGRAPFCCGAGSAAAGSGEAAPPDAMAQVGLGAQVVSVATSGGGLPAQAGSCCEQGLALVGWAIRSPLGPSHRPPGLTIRRRGPSARQPGGALANGAERSLVAQSTGQPSGALADWSEHSPTGRSTRRRSRSVCSLHARDWLLAGGWGKCRPASWVNQGGAFARRLPRRRGLSVRADSSVGSRSAAALARRPSAGASRQLITRGQPVAVPRAGSQSQLSRQSQVPA